MTIKIFSTQLHSIQQFFFLFHFYFLFFSQKHTHSHIHTDNFKKLSIVSRRLTAIIQPTKNRKKHTHSKNNHMEHWLRSNSYVKLQTM